MRGFIGYRSNTYLIGVNVDDLVHVEREQDVEEQDLVAPDDPLLLALSTKPLRPFVGHKFDTEPFPQEIARTAVQKGAVANGEE